MLTAVSVLCCFHLPLSFLQSFLLWSTSRHFDVCLPWLCLFRSSALLFLSFCMGAWSTFLVSLPCVSFLGFHSSLFPSGRLFMSFFRRSSDLVESPLHYATGSPFGPSQLLISLLAFHYGSHSSWVSSPSGGPSPRSTSVLRWVFLAFDFLLGSFPFTWAPTCCFLRLLSVPSVCPPLALILALARVSHYFCFFPPGASVESQFLRDGVLPPGRVSSVGVFVHSFPWFTSCPLLLVYFSSASIPPSISRCLRYCLLRRFSLQFLSFY